MPEEIDETKDSSSESDEEEMDELDSSSDTDAGADTESTDDEEDSEISPRTQKRMNDLLKQRKAARVGEKKAKESLSWYQENIGDPEDVIAFRKWKQEQEAEKAKAKKETKSAASDTSPEKIKAIRDLVLTAVPELKESFSEKQQRQEALWDRAEREVITLAKDAGLSDDPKFLRRFGYNVMLVVNDDEKLSKRFHSGDTSAIRDAYKIVEEEYHGKLQGALAKNAKDIDTKRKASRLPTAPAGSTTVSHKPRKHKGKGLDAPGLADEAWVLIRQSE